MKIKKVLILASIIPLSSCGGNVLNRNVMAFDTVNSLHLYSGSEDDLDNLESIINNIDKLTDNYQERDVLNVTKINQTNEDVQIDSDLYEILKVGDELSKDIPPFSIYCGGLAKLWKESLNNQQIPDESSRNAEVEKIKNTSLEFKEGNVVRRLGEGEIDLGALAKGYALDKCYSYLKEHQIANYYLSMGSSSNLLGDKTYYGADEFEVEIKKSNWRLKLHNCYISTSGISEQSVTIDGVIYSHIVNPNTGKATPIYSTVLVVSDNGLIGDALSTAFMLSSLDNIKALEEKYNVKSLVLSGNDNVVYSHPDLNLFKTK